MKAFSYEMGKIFFSIKKKFSSKITVAAENKIASRPDLIIVYLRHLNLKGFSFPAIPANFTPTAGTTGQFYLGYYHTMANQL